MSHIVITTLTYTQFLMHVDINIACQHRKNYNGIILPLASEINYVNMQHVYINMRLIFFNMQNNYVAC